MATFYCFRDLADDDSVTYRLLTQRAELAELLGRPIGRDLVLNAWMLPVFDPISDDERFGIVSLEPTARLDVSADAPSTSEVEWKLLRVLITAEGCDVSADAARVEIRVGAPVDLGEDEEDPFRTAGREEVMVDELAKWRRQRAAERGEEPDPMDPHGLDV